jgi:hypothetical protein
MVAKFSYEFLLGFVTSAKQGFTTTLILSLDIIFECTYSWRILHNRHIGEHLADDSKKFITHLTKFRLPV